MMNCVSQVNYNFINKREIDNACKFFVCTKVIFEK